MLLQTSIDRQIENLMTVASIPTLETGEIISEKIDLSKNYRKFIANYYNRYLPARDANLDLFERLVTDLGECSKLSKIFHDGVASRIDDLDQSSAIEFDVVIEEQTEKRKIMESGLGFLKATSFDHYSMIDLLVTDIVILPSKVAYGGSTSDGLGIIWANPNMNWRAVDTAEFLVHELTHQCMFLDEICSSHYDYELILQEENWSQSAILNKLRPVDKVLHSIAVATELLLFRERVGHPASSRAHPPTTKLVQQLESSITSLMKLDREKPKLLKMRARAILENCAAHVASVELEGELEI